MSNIYESDKAENSANLKAADVHTRSRPPTKPGVHR
jgi:hypothetical protein